MTTAPAHEVIDIQNVDGVTHVVRSVPLGGFENIASMNASATGSTTASRRPGGGTGASGTWVNRLGTRPGYYAAASSSGIAVTT